jgi:arginyl-tRNA synthetase
MDLKDQIARQIHEALARLHPDAEHALPQVTLPKQKDMGDYAAVLFPAAAKLRLRPLDLTLQLADELRGDPLFASVEASGGFLNFRVRPSAVCTLAVREVLDNSDFGGSFLHHGASVMVEYSSPNTNKPLHLGHIRNNVLGMSLCHLFDAVGYRVHPVCLVNDRGIHICKSMVAYKRFGGGETPESTGEKGDHFVGRYYVRFEQAFREELATDWAQLALGILRSEGADEEEARQKFFNTGSSLGREAREMLQLWEDGDPATVELWKAMNGWVYAGFAQTYHALGSRFEKIYHESETYKLGNNLVDEGLEKGVFTKNDDGSVWVDLSDKGLGKKLLRRRDGTSVYMTQDLGTAVHKFEDFGMDLSVYVVGSEQNHHFQVLFEILRKLGYPWAEHGLFHMSYGMVYLPTGKMKSREGTVVDADDLIGEMTERVLEVIRTGTEIRVPPEEVDATARQVALGALKFYLLLVTPSQDMNFDPQRSVALKGDTGVSVQYAAARINSILGKAGELLSAEPDLSLLVETEAVDVAKRLLDFPAVVEKAAEERSPALVARALLDLKEAFSQFYQKLRVIGPEGGPVEGNAQLSAARLALCRATRQVLVRGLALLGIDAPARM